MVRAFTPDPVPPGVVDDLVDLARRAPAAGNTQTFDVVVLEGDDTARFWDVSLPPARREGFGFPGLVAPVLLLPLVRPAAYPERYAEPDKAGTGLGAGTERWATPYWWVDGGMAVMALLLGAVDAGLGASLFGLFERAGRARHARGSPRTVGPWGRSPWGTPPPTPRAGRRRAPGGASTRSSTTAVGDRSPRHPTLTVR